MHPNGTLKAAGVIWVQVLVDLIRRPDNQAATFRSIFERAEQSPECDENIQEWLREAKQQELMRATKNIGWAKIAWSYGMNLLHRLAHGLLRYEDLKYREVVEAVIVEAGDTDTNAAIVGGLLGAIIGFTNLPTAYLQTMFSLRFEQAKGKTKRPSHYEPLNVLLVAL